MFKIIAVLAVLPALLLAGEVSFEACKYPDTSTPSMKSNPVFSLGTNGGHLPDWVAIEGCDMTLCNVWSNQPIHVSGEVTTINNSNSLTVTLHAFLAGIGLPLNLPEDVQDGCQVTSCPVTAGNTVRIQASMAIEAPAAVANMQLPIELAVTNESGARVFCVRTNVMINA